mmetsp:Transcript_19385/g.25772  ORF Transcript_19385/g.25772 Transcript_19385/m.25772 type:complete len:84 (+) Transcript_19385:2-253(+)
MIQISALFLGWGRAEEVCVIEPGVNFLTMESISMIPPQCNGVLLLPWGEPFDRRAWRHISWEVVKESYHGMKLILNQYKELTE